eukprot:m.62392 g.62392  ORF g.62392 m.62392 type:complete len:250 (-) comp17675_c0_seq7:326-1075(-)
MGDDFTPEPLVPESDPEHADDLRSHIRQLCRSNIRLSGEKDTYSDVLRVVLKSVNGFDLTLRDLVGALGRKSTTTTTTSMMTPPTSGVNSPEDSNSNIASSNDEFPDLLAIPMQLQTLKVLTPPPDLCSRYSDVESSATTDSGDESILADHGWSFTSPRDSTIARGDVAVCTSLARVATISSDQLSRLRTMVLVLTFVLATIGTICTRLAYLIAVDVPTEMNISDCRGSVDIDLESTAALDEAAAHILW